MFWNAWFELYTGWGYVLRPYGIIGKDFFRVNDMSRDVATILKKGL